MGKAVNPHPFMTPQWYRWTHESLSHPHTRFMRWVQARPDIKTILEVGCGMHDFYHTAFREQVYVGLDRSEPVIEYCRNTHTHGKLGGHAWECGDITKHLFPRTFDLVFSHAVIDHAPNPDVFLQRCIHWSSQYVYVMSYRGCFPELSEHKVERGTDGFYYADISMPQIRRLLSERTDVGRFDLVAVPTGRAPEEIQEELHIIVELKGTASSYC